MPSSSRRQAPKAFAEKLAHLRTQMGITQTALAAVWDISSSRSMVSELETGSMLPSLSIICKAVVLFQVDVDYWVFDNIPITSTQEYRVSGIKIEDLAGSRLGAKVKYLREKREMSERDLAQALNVSRSYIYNIESGRRQVSPDTLVDIATYFHITASSIVNDTILTPQELPN